MNTNEAVDVTEQLHFKVSYPDLLSAAVILSGLWQMSVWCSLMDFGLINDETYPEADNLKKSMYGFGF